ncbi:MAG: Fe-S cluster assembly protein SufD [Alphaproteobacteria bacterium]|nr:Fe-S cluster assembly protein SufD [Alphaproteobacteria bacterium]
MTLAALIERSRVQKESWRYTPLEKLLATPISAPDTAVQPLVGEAGHPVIAFRNGRYYAATSRLEKLPVGMFQVEGDNACRITVGGRHCLVTTPVELHFAYDNTAQAEPVQLYIELGESSSLTLIEHHAGSATAPHVVEMNVTLSAQAKLRHSKLMHQQAVAVHLTRTQVSVASGAHYHHFALLKDARLTRHEVDVRLQGLNAQCSLSGVMLLAGHEHGDATWRVTHEAPQGTSNQLFKTILTESARGVFQGKVIVAPDAQKTDSQQLSRALLLSDQAEMNAKPELQIDADDVSCSHGSTVGDLDDNALFYLRSRGLSDAAARRLLLRAFADEVVENLHAGEGHEVAAALLEEWFHENV